MPRKIHIPIANTWTYQINDDWIALAGKTDEDNDILSIRQARGSDCWFHIHGQPGSHVILQGPEGEIPDRKILETAAAIAAWHSKARNGGTCTVDCTLARNVSKPRGVPAGTVTITHSKLLKVRPGLPSDNQTAFHESADRRK